MTFLGQFHFRSPEAPDFHHGTFSCLVEGDDPHDAFHAFACLIRDAAEKSELFPRGTEIYCDTVIETHPLPPGGVIAWFEAASGDAPPATLYNSLVHPPGAECRRYNTTDPNLKAGEVEPFLVIGDSDEKGLTRRWS